MKILDFGSSERLVKKYRLNTPKQIVVKNLKQALNAAKQIRYPLVMKLLSDKLVHKTDVGAVITDIKDDDDLEQAFYALQKVAKKHRIKFEAVLVQEKLKGIEFIVGGKKDPQFGPFVLFGLGGIFTEIIEDISIRICPVSRMDAEEMVNEIRGKKVMDGIRGLPPVNKRQLVETIIKVSKMMEKEKIAEMDLNPVICNENACYCADVRIVRE
ncbi:acetyl-CoA synthetase [Candidatus Micrarchaeota archaeon]|nr:MAG: acetyl-CoA synthetase [Candidatus Micrarchaeota archaeon]